MSEDTLNNQENQELYEHYRFTADKGQRPLRIDKYLMNLIENATRNKIQNAASAGNILVNQVPVKQNYKVKPGDIISIVLTYPPQKIELIAEDIPISIVYEDKDVIVVHKQPGMVVHPGYANYTGTLLNALIYHFEKNKEEEQPHLVHRIDKDTSGLLLVAKNELAQSKLARQFFDHSVERKYQALVWGDFDNDADTIEGHLARHPKDRRVMKVFPDGSKGKEAITHYRVLKRFTYVSFIECELETGRTHQIRAHMKYIGHPLFNDETYGGEQILKGTTFSKYKQFVKNCFEIIPRQALHAKSLGFTHPSTGKEMFFDSELPEDMKLVLKKWENYAVHKIQ